MPAYQYRAVDYSGRIARGSVAAANEWELEQNLSQSGLELIEARVKNDNVPARLRLPHNLAPDALARFTAQMTDLLHAGIPLPDSLRDTAQATDSNALRDALDDVRRSVSHGSTVAHAFERHPRLFPDVFTAILAAGEKGGDLAATFAQLARYASRRARTIAQMRRAIRYPLFLLLITVGVIGFMTTMVIPPIVQFLGTMDAELPLSTRILIAGSSFFVDYWWAALLLATAAIAALTYAKRHSERAALAIDRLILRVPVVGMTVRKFALARFAQSFAILFQSGIGIIDSLRGASVTLGNRALAETLDNAVQHIQSGRALSASMIDIFPPFAVHMMRIGERSGKLGKALDDIADHCDRDAGEASTKLIGAMEPALTIAIGMILAWIVLAVLGPIYGNIAKISGSG